MSIDASRPGAAASLTLALVRRVVAGGAAKAKDASRDAQASNEQGKPVGYVAQARDLAGKALATAES